MSSIQQGTDFSKSDIGKQSEAPTMFGVLHMQVQVPDLEMSLWHSCSQSRSKWMFVLPIL